MRKIAISFIALCLILMTGSVSAYFLYVLPKQHEESLAFEKQKFNDEQKTKQDELNKKEQEKNDQEAKIAQEKKDMEEKRDNCIAIAEDDIELAKMKGKDYYDKNCTKLDQKTMYWAACVNTSYSDVQKAKDDLQNKKDQCIKLYPIPN